MLAIENEGLFRQALGGGINLFLGAGFSVLANGANNKPLPVGTRLRDELVDHFQIPNLKALNLAKLSQVLKSQNREKLTEFLKDRLSVTKFDRLYFNLHKMQIKKIYTTNIDDLVNKIFENQNISYLHDVLVHGSLRDDASAILYYALHGSVRANKEFIFTPTEISAEFSNSPDHWHLVRRDLGVSNSLFWGFSLDDADVLQALYHVGPQQPVSNKWILLRDADEAASAFFHSLGFQIIHGDTKSLLEFAGGLSGSLAVVSTDPGLRHIFRNELIPAASEIPAKPIRDFFLGAAPTWSDVASPQLHTLSQIKTIQNHLFSDKSVAVVGLPLSGKTTLMMQAAFYSDFGKTVLFVDALTVEKARFIKENLQSSKAIVFVDNLVDSVDAVQELMRAGIQIVASDRDYRYESIAHRFDRRELEIVRIAELEPQDAQAIYDTIPYDVRRRRDDRQSALDGTYIFEVIDSNVASGSIRERFRKVLRELDDGHQEVLDLLIMLSYVHDCRCYVSFDMIFLFLDKKGKKDRHAFSVIEKLRELVREYDDEVDDASQDYYRARSSAVADAVLKECTRESFRRVFERFHDVISPMIIPRYDIFRRYAYDDNFARKAFSEWQDGKRFYERLVRRTDNPYDWQHGALYLSGKKKFQEAFNWIDTAISKSGSRIFSIRNSHARILFDANIRFAAAEPGRVRPQLDESMKTLGHCYAADRQKIYHVVRFSDQACQYFDVYRDNSARQYLLEAREWIEGQMRDAAWHRRMPQLRKEILQRLDGIK